MGNTSIIRIIICIAIIGSFFMPLSADFSALGVNVSAWDLMYETLKNADNLGDMPFPLVMTIGCLLVIFITAAVVLIFSLMRRSSSGLLAFVAAIALVIYIITQSKDNVGEVFKSFGAGFYVMIIGSILLPFVGRFTRR